MSGTELALPSYVSISETSLEIEDGLGFEAWKALGSELGRVARANQWWVGDWLNYGDRAYGDKFTEALEVTGLALKTLKNCKLVAARIEKSRRRDFLSWSHHGEVAALAPADQERWLDVAKGNGSGKPLGQKALREAMRDAGARLVAHPRQVPKTLDLNHPRNRQMAEKAKTRTERAVGTCNGLSRGLDDLKIELAMQVASPQDVRGWESSFTEAISAIRRLRARLKEPPK